MTPFHIADYSIKDKRLSAIMSQFTTNWKAIKYNLKIGGFTQTTPHTFAHAQMVATNPYMTETPVHPLVFPQQINRMATLINDNTLSYVTLNYPTLAAFEMFYFKERHPLVQEVLEQEVWEDGLHNQPVALDKLIEEMDYVWAGADNDTKESISNEMEVLKAIDQFADACIRQSEQVQGIFKEHIERINWELLELKKTMPEKQYVTVRQDKFSAIQSLQKRFEMGIVAMMSFGEN